MFEVNELVQEYRTALDSAAARAHSDSSFAGKSERAHGLGDERYAILPGRHVARCGSSRAL